MEKINKEKVKIISICLELGRNLSHLFNCISIILFLTFSISVLVITIINKSTQNRRAFRIIGNKSDHLCEGNLFYFIRVNNVKQIGYNIVSLLTQPLYNQNKLFLIDYTITVCIFCLEASN